MLPTKRFRPYGTSVVKWFLLAGLAAMSGCDTDNSPCSEAVRHIEECGWSYTEGRPCTTAEDRCATACLGKLSCKEFAAYMDGFIGRKTSLCIWACYETFTCADESDDIPEYWVCDLEEDCIDGSDERDCHYFECRDGSQLLPEYDQCDGYEDCEDGSDESHCPFECFDGSGVIDEAHRCDGYEDCEDGSDELDCDLFECFDGSAAFPQGSRCDGYEDCEDGSDESYCPFECADGSGVIPDFFRCDGSEDCDDGSDEMRC